MIFLDPNPNPNPNLYYDSQNNIQLLGSPMPSLVQHNNPACQFVCLGRPNVWARKKTWLLMPYVTLPYVTEHGVLHARMKHGNDTGVQLALLHSLVQCDINQASCSSVDNILPC